MVPGKPRSREPLTVARIVATAVALADDSGLQALSMRALGRRLGVEGMAIYHHVPNKERLLDLLVDEVFAELDLPTGGWRPGMRARSVSHRAALRRHPWAVGLVESRATPGPKVLAYHDAVVGFLRGHGFDPLSAARALAITDAYVYGFVIQERELPTDPTTVAQSLGDEETGRPYPHLDEIVAEVVKTGYHFSDDFETGLDLVLDAVAGLLGRPQP